MPRILVAVLLAVATGSVARGDGAVRPTRLDVVPNFHAASVYAYFDGDENVNATALLEYRAGSATTFRRGHPLSRTAKGRFAGSIFYLQPKEPLEVRVTFDDPDGLADGAACTLTAQTQTRSETFPPGSGKTYYVGPQGNDGSPGTKEKPFRTIQHAADLAEPGDSIHLLHGTYRESVTIRRAGRPDAYITIRPDPTDASPPRRAPPADGGTEEHFPARARLAGWVAAENRWQNAGPDLMVLDEKRRVGAVTLTLAPPAKAYRPVGTRIYHHRSLEELKKADVALLPGWWQDGEAGKLYLRGTEGSPVTAHTVRLGVLPFGLKFEGAGYWVVEGLGFELFGGGEYGRGVDVVNSRSIIIRHCQFDVMRTGVAIRRPRSADCLVERCSFRDNKIWDWPWKAVKSHDTEGSAVSLSGAGGNVVRHNDIRGWFNGIDASTWSDLENEALNRDLDIHHNTFTEIGDDPMEPEGTCMNVRFWHNRTFDTLQGISLAPITVGPTYVVRDRYVNFKGGAVKVSVKSRGFVYLYHVLGFTARERRNAMNASGPWDNMHFRNSILRGTGYVIEDYYEHPIGCSFDYCCFHTTDPQRLVKWADRRYGRLSDLPGAAGFGPHNLVVPPYRSVEGGPPADLAPELIDAGVVIPGINDDFQGKGPDIGPDEVR